MLFSSATFLFVFLPLVLFCYFLPVFKKGSPESYEMTKKNLVLCLASLVFYAWGEPVYVVLMLVSIYFNFNITLDFQRFPEKKRRKKTLFIFAVIFNLFVLGFFKYEPFLVENINRLFSLHLKAAALPLPVGISFYTFQILSYVIDVYKGESEAQPSLLRFATYITMFPQLIAGPIVQYGDIERQLENRTVTMQKFSRGVLIFVRGLGKKMIFANAVGAVFSEIQGSDVHALGAVTAWFGILCYTLQIYFDFSGYSDMAIGLGRMFGFELMQNFNYPYTAESIKDFWSRWHSSLSGWFKKYVYIPLGGNRKGTVRTVRNILIVWTRTGLWHGAAWNFVLWGLYYGVLLLIEKLVIGKRIERVPRVLRWLVTFVLVNVGWVLFNLTDIQTLLSTLRDMFVYVPTDWQGLLALDTSVCSKALALPFALLFSFPVFRHLELPEKGPGLIAVNGAFLVLLLVCVMFIVSSSFTPFVYFNF